MNDNYNTNQNTCLDWDSTLENDGQGSILLPEGDYEFTVINFERGRFRGSAKLPACNKAALTLRVVTPNGTANVHTDLYLVKTLEWLLSAFFRCIGQKKYGERLTMDWSKVVGSRGYAHFKIQSYTTNGKERQTNSVDKFYDYNEKNFTNSSLTTNTEDELPF